MSDVRIDLDRLVELEKNATAIPWYDFKNVNRNAFYSGLDMRGVDWQLASALRNAAPAMMRVVRAARKMRETVEVFGGNEHAVNALVDELDNALAEFEETEK